MQIKNKRNSIIKILVFLGIVVAVMLIYEIMHIYALFHSDVTANVQFTNGVWKIVVNGTQISRGVETSFVIDNIETESNQHVHPNKLAPGLSGGFEISIVPQDTDVSIKYDIILNQEAIGNNNNIKIKSIEEIEEENTLIRTGENTYTAVIPLQDIKNNVTNTINMEVEWQNDDVYDDDDTELGSRYNEKLHIPITVKVVQYLGEEIVPYVEEEPETEPIEENT